MIALKTIRAELGEVLADGLGVIAAPFGANVNPPCVLVQAGQPYLAVQDYCTDHVALQALVLTNGGEGAATADALDDMLDQVRSTLKSATSSSGLRYAMRSVEPPELFLIASQQVLGALVEIHCERSID